MKPVSESTIFLIYNIWKHNYISNLDNFKLFGDKNEILSFSILISGIFK